MIDSTVGGIVGSVGQRVKIHKITSDTGKERGDLEIKKTMYLLQYWKVTCTYYRTVDKHKVFGW
jgi:hypothetical protein